MKKHLISLILAVAMLLCFCAPTLAETEEPLNLGRRAHYDVRRVVQGRL